MKPYVYIATSLFSPVDRLSALNLSNIVIERISEEFNMSLSQSRKSIFLPYRDSRQSELVGNDRAKQE